jgi:hypothetical protein
MGSLDPSSPLRQVLDGRLSQLSGEVVRLFDEARGLSRRELADQLNQSVRRIRQAISLSELATTLVDGAMAFAAGAAIFLVTGTAARGEKIRGVTAEAGQAFHALEIPFPAAPALAGAVETRDPVIAVTTAAEVSAEMMSLAEHPADGRAYIYPLVVKGKVPALLYCWETTQGPALEMLAQFAAAVWDALVVPEPPELVSIAPAAKVSAWDALAPEDQAVHLRAQRFARVQVSEMRLHDGPAVQSGRTQRNLYDALRSRIDNARVTFQQSYCASCSSMVDYLHVELVRTLANNDPDLLGKNYPGPLF